MRAPRALGVGVFFGVTFMALDLCTALYQDTSTSGISLWYAPVGFAFAILLRFGVGYAPVYMLVSLLDDYVIWRQHIEPAPVVSIAMAIIPGAVYSLFAWILRKRLRIDPQLSELRSAAVFMIGGCLASAIVALGYASIMYAAGRVAAPEFLHWVKDFWIGDFVAILSIVPFLQVVVFPSFSGVRRLFRRQGRGARSSATARRGVREAAYAMIWLAFLLPTIAWCVTETKAGQQPVLYPCFIPLVYAAYWRGIKGASIGVVVVSVAFAIYLTPVTVHEQMHGIQLFLITLCVSTLALGAAVSAATQSAEGLRQVHDVYRQAISAANSVPYVLDYREDRYAFVGEGIEHVTGYAASEFTPALWNERSTVVTLHGDAAGLAREDAMRRIRDGKIESWSSEGKFLARDGTIHWVADVSVEVPGDDGKPIRSIGLIQDITRLKQTEEALRSSRTILNLFVEHAPAAVAMLDRDLRYLVVSQRWIEDYHLTGKDIFGMRHYDIFPEIRDNQDWTEVHRRCLAGAVVKRDEDLFVRADGTEEWLRWEVRPWYDDEDAIGGIIMFTEVITEKKKAEAALRRSEERLELALSGADLGLWDLMIGDGKVAVNERCAEMLGYSLATVPAAIDAWRDRVHPDDLAAVSDHIWAHFMKHLPNLDMEFRVYTRMGRRLWVQFRGKVVEWAAGSVPVRLTGTIQDITAQKALEDERRALEEQMQQTQKLESLGVLAGGIAHDFNNLLVGILGNADLALADAPLQSSMRESLDAIVTASERAAELCRQMLAYSGRGKFVVAPVSLNDLVKEISQLLMVTVPKKVSLRFDPDPELPLVNADATQIRQIVMNLITNASEAIGDRDGTIRMETGRLTWAGDDSVPHAVGGELRESKAYAYVRVSDTGAGMDPVTLQRIFDPFFTTKFTGRGLGLAAVLGIVRGHGGAIRVESEPGQGSTFTVYLPSWVTYVEDTPNAETADMPARGEGTVLVVDDEEPVLAIAKSMLERRGFAVLIAGNGEEALRLYEREKDTIVLAIIDLTMPRMGGGELVRALHERAPELRVVLSSGYNEQEAVAQSHGEQLAGFIQKPYRASEFYAVIQSALNRGTAAQ